MIAEKEWEEKMRIESITEMDREINTIRELIQKDTGEELELVLDFIVSEELLEEYLEYRKDYYHDKNIPLELSFSEDFLKGLEEE